MIKDSATFRAVRNLSAQGTVWADGGFYYFQNKLGIFAAPDLHMLKVFLEDLEMIYGALDVEGRAVADVGAYLGETAVFFAKRGARYVYAYEPVFHTYTEYNLRLNNVKNATVHPYGLWVEDDELSISPAGLSTGLTHGTLKIQVKPLAEALNNVNVVKMDCEGCEWALIAVPCEVIRRAEEYVVEVHGPEPQLIRRMEKCGFKPKLVSRPAPLVSVWRFSL